MNIKYELNNKYRVLLTEVLPYELPLILDNTAFYHIANKNSTEMLFYNECFEDCKRSWTIPFDYKVRFRGGEKSRGLSLMHPSIQLRWTELYEKYATYMLYLCSRSPFSIRRISELANCLIDEEKMVDDDLYFEGINKIELFDACYSKQYQSFFRYEKYNVIYKFYESGDFLRLEQKYPYLLQTDISKCFYHIYTHSVAWAIKNKEFAKEHTNNDYSFENKLDTIMQHGNYNETNGIIVGPEISRIFAEIILQRIDLDLLDALKRHNLHLGTEYEIRRYVDDYFIFAQKREYLEIILNTLSDCLIPYKLDINKSKTVITSRPFANSRSDAKQELSNLVDELDKYIIIEAGETKTRVLASQNKLFKQIIGSFRKITHHYGLSYSDLSSYMLTLLRKKVIAIEKQKENLSNTEILFALCNISFYIYSLDIYASVSHKICDIMYLLHKATQNIQVSQIARVELITTIEREVQRCLHYNIMMQKEDEVNLEIMNLLLALDSIVITPLSVDKIAYILGKESASSVNENDFKNLNYFQISVLLYLMNTRTDMAKWKTWLLAAIPNLFTKSDWKRHADSTCLFFDLMVCPFITKVEKINIMMVAMNYNSNTAGNKLKKIAECKRWFVDWNRNRDFGQLLEKKRYHFAYG